jgi:hypothetical protein
MQFFVCSDQEPTVLRDMFYAKGVRVANPRFSFRQSDSEYSYRTVDNATPEDRPQRDFDIPLPTVIVNTL